MKMLYNHFRPLLLVALMFIYGVAGAQCTAVPPGSITVGPMSCTSATAGWGMVSGATGYEYYFGTTPPPGSGTFTTTPSASESGLTPSTVYMFYVRADCGGGSYSAWSSPVTLTTPACPSCAPVSPGSITVGAMSCTTATASWGAVAGAVGYEYYLGTTAPSGAGTPITATNVSASGLAPGTTYFFYVRADCGGGNYSTWSSPNTILTPICPCPAPLSVTIGPMACDSVLFAWSPVSGVSGYEYVLDMSPSDPAGAGTATTHTDMSVGGLMGGTVYYAHVRTICGTGLLSSWVTVMVTTPPCACPAPLSVTIGPMACDSVLFAWSPMSGVSGYEYVLDMSPADPTGSGTPTMATDASVGGLMGGTVYYAHVRNVCTGGYSAWMTVAVTTPPCSYCMPPAAVVTAPGAGSVDLSWGSVAGAAGYEYVIDHSAANPSVAGTSSLSTVASVSGLTPETGYFVHLRTICAAGGHSDWTTAQAFSTTPATGVGNLSTTDQILSAFPNPANEKVIVTVAGQIAEGAELSILSVDGREISKVLVSDSRTEVNINGLIPGIYILKYKDATKFGVITICKK